MVLFSFVGQYNYFLVEVFFFIYGLCILEMGVVFIDLVVVLYGWYDGDGNVVMVEYVYM